MEEAFQKVRYLREKAKNLEKLYTFSMMDNVDEVLEMLNNYDFTYDELMITASRLSRKYGDGKVSEYIKGLYFKCL